MNSPDENSNWDPVPEDASRPAVRPDNHGPYELSTVGEYARLLLLLICIPMLGWFIYTASTLFHGIPALIATVALLASLITSRGPQLFRIALMIAMTLNVVSMVVNRYKSVVGMEEPPTLIPIHILGWCLVLACCFEINGWLRSASRTTLIKTLAWSTLAIPAVIYAIGVPIFNSVLDSVWADEKQLALRDPGWSIWSEISFRAAKFMIFFAFTYLGACLGSFLNVVAYSIPRGKGIGFRDSKCPQCGTKISRTDNLPIFSYVNLGGRCRSCKVPIPFRYLLVELVVATVFGSLFLYELVTGCANVPWSQVSHQGILWVILYPKWPAIASYFYHAFFMSGVLTLALFEWDRQPLKPAFAIVVVLGFFIPALFYWPIQTVPVTAHLPITLENSAIINQLLKLVAGGLLGSLIGFGLGYLFSTKGASILTMAFLLTGMVLGWQALVQVTMVFTLMVIVARLWSTTNQLLMARPTTILLVAIMLHQPFWKIISDLWMFA